ncbi:MAG: T9SS type A sorting domain-containing protein, partial [Muribaculaceae bacterium]|nr:T9SS type A sorting domain-containing protein [Muribaculaceae bacterium]
AAGGNSNITINNPLSYFEGEGSWILKSKGQEYTFILNTTEGTITVTNPQASIIPGKYTIRIPQATFSDNSGNWTNEAISFSYNIIDNPIYHFGSANPPSGTTYYESQSLPSSIETLWQNIDNPVIIRKNAVLRNENNDSIVGLMLSQSPTNQSLIFVRSIIPLGSIKVPVGTYYIQIPKDSFTDESGVWSNEEVRLQYNISADPIYHFESANPPSGTSYYENESLPSSIETQWQNIDEPIVVRRNAVLRNENNDSIVGLTLTQSSVDQSLISVQSLIPFSSIKIPVGTYTVHIPQNTFTDESGVWYNEDVKLEYTILPLIQLASPTISYNGRFVTIEAPEDDAEILYSVNGNDFTPYVAGFDLGGLNSVRAYARKTDYSDSDIVEYQVHSYGTEMYAELDSEGSFSDAYQWADAATRNEINSNTNLLIYVPDIETANALTDNHTNIVIDGNADRITLNDAFPWYCPYEFEAANVTYTHSFTKQTAIDGGCAGWETIALPFDVQAVTHDKGDLYTFAANSDDYAHRFWLYKPDSYEWQPATAIEANVPYLIAMPNNPVYYDPFNITGEVTFSAQGVTIPATPATLSYDFRDGYQLNVNYLNLAADPQRLVVNDEAVNGNEPGSCFVADQRAVRPFEAYLSAPGQNQVPIFNTTSLAEGLMTEMALRVWCDTPQSVSIAAPFDAKVNIYDLSGRAVRTVKVPSGETVRIADLPSGLYIIAKTKIAIIR